MVAFSLLAFDLDGTLVDTERESIASVISLLKQHYGVHVTLEHWLAHYLGKGGPELLHAIEADFGVVIPWDEFLPLRRSYLQREFASGVPVAAGAHRVLAGLHAGGRTLALCSNAMEDRISRILGKALVAEEDESLPTLEAILAGRTYAAVDNPRIAPKPAPDVYLAAALDIHAAPHACLAVEDSPTGVKAAVAAGFYCVGYVGLIRHPELEAAKLEELGAQRIIHHWDEFLPLLAELEA